MCSVGVTSTWAARGLFSITSGRETLCPLNTPHGESRRPGVRSEDGEEERNEEEDQWGQCGGDGDGGRGGGSCGGVDESADESLMDVGDTATSEETELPAHREGVRSKRQRRPPEWMRDYVLD